MKEKLTKILILSTLVLVLLGNVSAQQQTKDILITAQPKPCEFNNLALEQASRDAGRNSLVILIARPGIKDTKKDISKKRLYSARAYLVEYGKFRSSEEVVAAEAISDGRFNYGGVEIYVNGKLVDILTSKPDGLLALGSCTHPDAEDDKSKARNALLYPWTYKNK